MSIGNSKSSSAKAVLGLGPAIPLVIALLHSAVVPSTGGGASRVSNASEVVPVACGEGIEDYLACHSEYPTGCNSNGKYDAYLNEFKNQVEWTNSSVQRWFTALDEFGQLESELPTGLGKNNHGDYEGQLATLGEGKISGVVGYLYAVKPEGKESSNCQLDPGENNENVDFHIYIGFDAKLASRIRDKTTTAADKSQINPSAVIVEMTPHYRARFHPEWTLASVQEQLGKRVRITGQLMVDNEHYVSSQDCGRKDHTTACWRATVWELHPVTNFEVCDSGACDQASAGWDAIGTGGSDAIAANARSASTQAKPVRQK
jgi:hypothetical protein